MDFILLALITVLVCQNENKFTKQLITIHLLKAIDSTSLDEPFRRLRTVRDPTAPAFQCSIRVKRKKIKGFNYQMANLSLAARDMPPGNALGHEGLRSTME